MGKTPFAAVNFTMPFLMILGMFGFMFGAGGNAHTLNLPADYTGALSEEGYADSTHFVECVGEKYLTRGEFAIQQPGYKIVNTLWIGVLIVVDIVCATILKRREKARQAA